MSALEELNQLIKSANSNFGVLNLTLEQFHEIFSLMNDCDVVFSEIVIENLCTVLYNAI